MQGGLQVRLRTMLIALAAVGAGVGLGGRLLLRDPTTFLTVLTACSTLAPFLAAVGTVAWIGVRERRPRLLAWAGLLVVTPLLGLAGVMLVQRVATGPGGLGMLSNARLIGTELPGRIDEPWSWEELSRRLQNGDLSAQEVNDAIGVLTAHMQGASPGGWDQPLSWQRRFLELAIESGMVADQTLIDLCEAYYGVTPRLKPLRRMRQRDVGVSIEVEYGNVWASHTPALPRLVWTVKQVRLDGRPLAVRQILHNDREWRAYYDQSIAAGEHELQVDVEAAFVPASQMVGLSSKDVTPGALPEGLKSWKETITQPLTVHGDQDELVRLLTRPADLGRGHGVRVKRLVVHKLADGRAKVVLIADLEPTAGPAISFNAAVRIDDREIPLDGGLMRVEREGGMTTTAGNQLEATVPMVVSDSASADVLLRPDPQHVERYPEVDAIWGQPVTIRGVPVERLDRRGAAEP